VSSAARLSAGREIDSWCTRCKLDLGHRIVAMVDGQPRRVVCLTCGSEHNHRPTREPTAAPARPTRSAGSRAGGQAAAAAPRAAKAGGNAPRGRAAAHARQEWETQVRSGRPFRRYSTGETFAVGDLLLHAKFGEGYVVAVADGRLSAAFADGTRTLAHAAKD
jgi:hypothetical protein